jgi:uncharacterized membrane protein YtjA (UPF0391 family)
VAPKHLVATETRIVVLLYAIVFLIVALIAGVLGFMTISGAATWIAQLLFAVFVVLFVVSLVIGRRPPG